MALDTGLSALDSLGPLWAVHISDGVLTWPWLVVGFVLAGLFVALACVRLRDEEIPRIALLGSAFFVASLIHLRLGPTSVHLLLNGLVGVILGWRAALAIVVGLVLQVVLLGHGGFTSLGVNACILLLPALLVGLSFRGLVRVRWVHHPWARPALVFLSSALWSFSMLFAIVLLCTNRWVGQVNREGIPQLLVAPALHVLVHPWSLLAVTCLSGGAAFLERRQRHAPGFALGLLLGVVAVLLTALLNALVLLWGGAEDWHTLVLLVFLAHLPVAVVEGFVLGFTVSFLLRVKPDLLSVEGIPGEEGREGTGPAPSLPLPHPLPIEVKAGVILLLGMLGWVTPGHAHGLEARYEVLPDGKIRIESWFVPTTDSPIGARVLVYRENSTLLREGTLNSEGMFVFSPGQEKTLRVLIDAGQGHRTELPIHLGRSAATATTSHTGHRDRDPGFTIQDVLLGITFLLAAGAFFLSLRNSRRLRALAQTGEQPEPHPPAV
jgi:ABC-type Co2+ transport system permease subunit